MEIVDGFTLSLGEIDDALTDIIPDLRRREPTERVFRELGIDALLDMRNELLEAMRQFEEIFNPE